MNLTPISNLRVGVLQLEGSRDVPVRESPFYVALENRDEEIFEEYRAILLSVSGTPDAEMTWDEFLKLNMSIWQQGFIVQEPRIRFNEQGICLDGHHRLSVLYYRFGDRLALEIINQEVHSVWVKSSK